MGASRFVQEFHTIGIVLGVVVYFFIYALALTACFPGRTFGVISSPRFQSVALYTIWFVFASAFVAGSVRRFWVYFPFAAISVGALSLRVVGNIQARREARRTAAIAGR
jgi:hypothetical protein